MTARFANPSHAAAANNDPVLVGNDYQGTLRTSLQNTTGGGASLRGYHATNGIGVVGQADGAGYGLQALATASGGRGGFGSALDKAGMTGYSTTTTPTHGAGSENVGVIGVAGDASPLATQDLSETGVYGFCDTSATNASGVAGQSVQGVGVLGIGQTGSFGFGQFGTLGVADENGIGLYGSSSAGGVPDVFGGAGVIGQADAGGTGVVGFTGPTEIQPTPDVGVYGRSDTGGTGGRGLVGFCSQGIGLLGQTDTGTGLRAYSGTNTGVALRVSGKAAFDRSGKLTISAGHSNVVKTGIALSASSFILATLQTNVAGLFVQAVVPSASGSKFTIYLNKAPTVNVSVAWLAVN